MELVLTELNPVPSQQVEQSHTGEGGKLTDTKTGASAALRFTDVEKCTYTGLRPTQVHSTGTKHPYQERWFCYQDSRSLRTLSGTEKWRKWRVSVINLLTLRVQIPTLLWLLITRE